MGSLLAGYKRASARTTRATKKKATAITTTATLARTPLEPAAGASTTSASAFSARCEVSRCAISLHMSGNRSRNCSFLTLNEALRRAYCRFCDSDDKMLPVVGVSSN